MKRLFFILVFISLFIFSVSVVMAANLTSEHYRIGIDDLLDINEINYPELRTRVTVASDGTINFPYIGIVNVAGMKLSVIEEDIAKKLSDGYVKNPIVSGL